MLRFNQRDVKETYLRFPVEGLGGACTVDIVFTGEATQAGVRRVIRLLENSVDCFPPGEPKALGGALDIKPCSSCGSDGSYCAVCGNCSREDFARHHGNPVNAGGGETT